MSTVSALYIDLRGPYPRMAAGETFRVLGPHGEPYCREWGPPREVDCWDATRDARKYAGPHPVVAHPPCKHWGRLRHLALGTDAACPECNGTGRWPVPHPLALDACPGCNGCGRVPDKDCAPRAVEQVRAYGGVLEHPAGSKLWEACGLPPPDFDVQPGGALHGKVARISSTRNERGDFADAHGGYAIELDQCEWGHVARKRTWLYLVDVPREALEAPPFPGREPTHWCSGNRKNKNGGSVPPGIKICSAQQRRRTPPLFAEYLVRLASKARRP